MKKNITISYDEEQLCALRLFAEQKDICLEEELTETVDGLYQKHVPANVRAYLDMKADGAKPKKKAQPAADAPAGEA